MMATITPLFFMVVQKPVSKTRTYGRREVSLVQARVGSLTPSEAMMTILRGLSGELPSPALPTSETKLLIRLSNGVAAAASSLATAGWGKLREIVEWVKVRPAFLVSRSSKDHSPTRVVATRSGWLPI